MKLWQRGPSERVQVTLCSFLVMCGFHYMMLHGLDALYRFAAGTLRSFKINAYSNTATFFSLLSIAHNSTWNHLDFIYLLLIYQIIFRIL